MNVQVRYLSRSGNTKKLADCIATMVGCDAVSIDKNSASIEADILFLGASVYWGGIDSKVKKYIESLDASKIKQVAIFSTSALAERGYNDIKSRLEKRGINVLDNNFYCRGEFSALHKGRPNEDDLKDCAAFAKEIIAE